MSNYKLIHKVSKTSFSLKIMIIIYMILQIMYVIILFINITLQNKNDEKLRN